MLPDGSAFLAELLVEAAEDFGSWYLEKALSGYLE